MLEFDNSTYSYRIIEPYGFIENCVAKSERRRIDVSRLSSLSDPENSTISDGEYFYIFGKPMEK